MTFRFRLVSPYARLAPRPPIRPLVFKHIASNWSRNLLQILVMLVLSPLMVEKLGEGGNGIWIAIIAATGFLELLALGVPMASVRHISEAVNSGDAERTNRMVATGYAVTIGLGVVGGVIGLILYFPFEIGLVENENWSSTPEDVLSAARCAYIITAVRVAAALSLRFPTAVFDSHHDFLTKNLIQNAGILFRAIAVVIVLYTNPSLVSIAWIFVVEALLVFAAFRIFIKRRFTQVDFSLKHFDRSLVKEILSFGIFAAILNVGTMIAYSIDGLVVGGWIGNEAITDFDLGNKFFTPLAAIMYGIGAVVMPTATRLNIGDSRSALPDVFLKWSKVALSVVLPVGLYLTVLGPRFIAAWVDPQFESTSGLVTRILAPSFILSLPIRAVALPILLGITQPARPALIYLGFALLNLGLSIALVNMGYGIAGVAIGTALPQFLFAIYLLLVTCAELELKPIRWIKYVGGRALIGSLPCVAFLLWMERGLDVRSFPALIAAGVGMLAIYSCTWIFFVYRGDRFLDLTEEVRLRLRK
ncbi:MAG: O-antigen/teichoic acid export membrane protein [Planctomycetota bacterium]